MSPRGLGWLRTWLPASIVLAGVALIAITRSESGAEGGVMLISAGLSVWLLNWLYRVSVRGDRDRDREDEARAFLDRHGYWPDEAPPGVEPKAATPRPAHEPPRAPHDPARRPPPRSRPRGH